jgi:hypothetical protein
MGGSKTVGQDGSVSQWGIVQGGTLDVCFIEAVHIDYNHVHRTVLSFSFHKYAFSQFFR